MRYIQPFRSCVYFAQAVEWRGRPVKIGFTTRLNDRLANVRHVTGCGRLELLGVMEGDRETETELHERFDGIRRDGEWFRPTRELNAFIVRQAVKPVPALPGEELKFLGMTTVGVRMSRVLHRALKLRAIACNTTLEQQIAQILSEAIDCPELATTQTEAAAGA